MQIIDLRSDTVTKPTKEMKEAMFSAKIGDDVFGEDPTVIELENKIAKMFGMEAALYCPSGTMANQIAIRINTQPQDEIICDRTCHIYNYEGGGTAYNSMVSVRYVEGDLGKINAQQVLENINPDDIHFPNTCMVALENTVNKGGGGCYNLKEIKAIHKASKDNNLKIHLDGARVFNALVKTGENLKDYGQYFDTISICFSKGLGAPIGSALLGLKDSIKKARRIRKVFGGGMRQVGFLAAACIYALDNHINRLAEDHQRAITLASFFESKPFVSGMIPIETNIVILEINPVFGLDKLLTNLKNQGILAVPFGKNQVRLVTHLDFTDEMLDRTKSVVESL